MLAMLGKGSCSSIVGYTLRHLTIVFVVVVVVVVVVVSCSCGCPSTVMGMVIRQSALIE